MAQIENPHPEPSQSETFPNGWKSIETPPLPHARKPSRSSRNQSKDEGDRFTFTFGPTVQAHPAPPHPSLAETRESANRIAEILALLSPHPVPEPETDIERCLIKALALDQPNIPATVFDQHLGFYKEVSFHSYCKVNVMLTPLNNSCKRL